MLYHIQHGFLGHRSRLTSVLCFLHEATRGLDEGMLIKTCCLHFIKAYDSATHRLVSKKLPDFGISGKLRKDLDEIINGGTFIPKSEIFVWAQVWSLI